MEHWGKGQLRRLMKDHYWTLPILWNKKAEAEGKMLKVFCGSMCDVMDDEAPEGQRERLWELIDATPSLLWLLLTKRPQRYAANLPRTGFARGNVLLMCTVEKQEFYLPRVKALQAARLDLQSSNAIHRNRCQHVPTGISYEPALGPLSVRESPHLRPDWIIFGGETGHGRRTMEQQWAESIKEECREFGIAFFMKQMSAATPTAAKALIPAHLLIQQHPRY